MPESKAQILYDAIKEQYELPDFDSFSAKLNDKNKRVALYGRLTQDGYSVGNFESFSNKVLNGTTQQSTNQNKPKTEVYTKYSDVAEPANYVETTSELPEQALPRYLSNQSGTSDSKFKADQTIASNIDVGNQKKGFWDSYAGDLIESAGSGVVNMYGNAIGSINKAYDVAYKLLPLDDKTMSALKLSNPFYGTIARSVPDIKDAANKLSDKSNRYGFNEDGSQKTFVDLYKEGDYAGMAGDVFLQATKSLPQSIGVMAAGTPGLVSVGVLSANEKYDILDSENPNMGEVAKISNAVLTGVSEALSEYSDKLLGKYTLGPLLKLGDRTAKKQIYTGVESVVKNIFSRYGLAIAPVIEGAEEYANQIATNIIDKATEADKTDKPITDGGLEAFVYGAGGGMQFSMIGGSLKAGQEINKHIVHKAYTKAASKFSDVELRQLNTISDANAFLEQNPESAEKVAKFMNAKAAYDRVAMRAENDIDDKIQQSESFIDGVSHKDGNVYDINLGDGGRAYVVAGKIIFNENGTLNRAGSDQRITVKGLDGKPRMIPISEVQSLVSQNNASELKSTSAQTIQEQEIQKVVTEMQTPTPEEARIEAINTIKQLPQDGFSINVDGVIKQASVQNIDRDGVAVLIKDGSQTVQQQLQPEELVPLLLQEQMPSNNSEYDHGDTVITPDGRQATIKATLGDQCYVEINDTGESVEYAMNEIKAYDTDMQSSVQILAPIAEESEPSVVADVRNDSDTADSDRSPIALEQVGKMTYPIDDEGNTDYSQIADPKEYAAALLEEFGSDSVGIINEDIESQEKQMLSADKNTSAIEKVRAKKRISAEIARLNAIKSFIIPGNIDGTESPTDQAEVSVTVNGPILSETTPDAVNSFKPVKKSTPNYRSKLDEILPNGRDGLPMRGQILYDIVDGGVVFLWGDSGKSRGVQSELFGKRSGSKKRAKVADEYASTLVTTNPKIGVTPEQYAERLAGMNYNQDQGVDDTPYRDIVLDVLQSITSRKDAFAELSQKYGEETAESEDFAARAVYEREIKEIDALGMTREQIDAAEIDRFAILEQCSNEIDRIFVESHLSPKNNNNFEQNKKDEHRSKSEEKLVGQPAVRKEALDNGLVQNDGRGDSSGEQSVERRGNSAESQQQMSEDAPISRPQTDPAGETAYNAGGVSQSDAGVSGLTDVDYEEKEQSDNIRFRDGNKTEIPEQISPRADGSVSEVARRMEEASAIVRREKEAAGGVEPTEGYKRGQIEALKEYAKNNDLWVENYLFFGDFLDKGGENEVYALDDEVVHKLNNFEYAGDDLVNFFDRMTAHNRLFPNAPYSLVGFSKNSTGEFCAVLQQPFIVSSREATPKEIASYMKSMGFKKESSDSFINDEYIVFDAVPNNVLKGVDDNLYFIDTQIEIVDAAILLAESKVETNPSDIGLKFRDIEAKQEFESIENDYEVLIANQENNPNFEQDLNDWRDRKVGVVRRLFDDLSERYGIDTRVEVFNGARDTRVLEELCYHDNSNASTEDVAMFIKEWRSVEPKPLALHSYTHDVILVDVSYRDVVNNAEEFHKALIHETVHSFNGKLISNETLINIYNESKNVPVFKYILNSKYYNSSDRQKGDEVVAYAIGSLTSSSKNYAFDRFMRNEISANEAILYIKSDIPYTKTIIIDVLNSFKDGQRQNTTGRKSTNRRSEAEDHVREIYGGGDIGAGGSIRRDLRQRDIVDAETVSAVETLATELNTLVRIIRDVNEITDSNKVVEKRKRAAKGWYDASTNEVVVVLPNQSDTTDTVATVLHEVVAHKGLKEMFGADFDSFLTDIYNNVDAETRRKIATKALRLKLDIRLATEEYLAELAEEGIRNPRELSTVWQTVKNALSELLRKIGINVKLTDNDLRYLLWKSYNRLKSGDSVLAKAAKVNKDSQIKDLVRSEDTRYRDVSEPDEVVVPDNTTETIKKKRRNKKEIIQDLRVELKELKAKGRRLEAGLRQSSKGIESVIKTKDTYANAVMLHNNATKRIKQHINNSFTPEMMPFLGKHELTAAMAQFDKSVSPEAVEKAAQRITNIALDAEIKHSKKELDQLLGLKVQGENQAGVAIAKHIDDNTRILFEYVQKNLGRKMEDLRSGLDERKHQDSNSGATWNASDDMKLEALYLIELYQDTNEAGEGYLNVSDQIDTESTELAKLRASRNSIAKIQKKSESNSDSVKDKLKADKKQIDSQIIVQQELLTALGWQLYEIKQDYADKLASFNDALRSVISGGRSEYLQWVKDRSAKDAGVLHMAFDAISNKDMEKVEPLDIVPGRIEKNMTAVKEFFKSPLRTMNYELKRVSSRHANGESPLYDHFMRSEDGYIAASGEYYDGFKQYKDTIDNKVAELFGKKYFKNGLAKLHSVARKIDLGVQIIVSDKEGRRSVRDINIGQALNLYLTNDQVDGEVKLRNMGISEQEIAKVVESLNKIDPRYIQFTDWVVHDFLPKTREKYNATHLRVFGTQMDNVENYWPLSVQKSSVREEYDGKIVTDVLPTTATGSIIKRKPNTTTIDVGVEFFEKLLSHGMEMEHWNAYTPVVSDMNKLLSSTTFRRTIEAQQRGSFERLKAAASISAEQYSMKVNEVNKFMSALSKMAASSKISLKLWTALKQLASLPAYIAYSSDPEFYKILIKIVANPVNYHTHFKWCLENIPSFRKRWEGRMAGNEKLAQDSYAWLDKGVAAIGKYGFAPNAFVDAFACCFGAVAAYQYKSEYYKQRGKSGIEADALAKKDAARIFNESQQSSEGAFLSKLQKDKDLLSVSVSMFQNSQMAYTRLIGEGINELERDRMEEVALLKKRYMANGLSEDKAKIFAIKDVAEAKRTAIFKLATYGFIMPFTWSLASCSLPWIFGVGDDDDDSVANKAIRAALVGPVQGLTLGGVVSSVVEGYEFAPVMVISEMHDFYKNYKDALEQEKIFNPQIAYTTLDMITTFSLGVDMQTFENVYKAVEGVYYKKDVTAEEFLYFISAPKSAIRTIVGQKKEGETILEYTERVHRAYSPFSKPATSRQRSKYGKQFRASDDVTNINQAN